MTVAVVRTGLANLASVVAGLRRAGAEPRLTTDPDTVRNAAALVLPGVGSFGAAMAELARHDLVGALRDRIERRLPTLAICLGLQLLYERSEESPGVTGLGVLEGSVRRITGKVRVPHFGWNEVRADGCSLLAGGYAYFANSFIADAAPDDWRVAWCDHGGPFVAAVERDRVVACQFHPELSGEFGRDLLSRWVAASREEIESC